MSAPHAEAGLDVVVRFHDPRRLGELEQAVFSLVAQEYRPLRILLVLQRFSDEQAEAVRAALAPLLALPGAPALEILRYAAPEPADARSALVNTGFAAAAGRYLALLDYDDILYPEAYRLLVGRLQATGAAIAFAGILVRRAEVHPHFLHVLAAPQPFHGRGLGDLLRGNFCPIHSFVLDRSRVAPRELHFEENLTLEEDYDFLLRVCARHRADFGLLGTVIGEYFFKTDESNTLAGRSAPPPALAARAAAARAFIEGRKQLLPLSAEVQADLGLRPPEPGLTIAQFLARRAP